ncbi:DUF6497 family protein [Gemmobacter nectariphilus]|uniref:DUF6497 family protein n=1 Tax=Gemmobacter nectariphilus TaxID=220343 RepID=UPI0004179101|nr:DUF6497 family protein [Gemmobacter nectariphilus]
MRGGLIAAILLASPAFGQELVPVPSGQPVTFLDAIWNEPGPAGLTARFRFVAPQIAQQGGTVDFDTASADMEDLCNTYALPRIETTTGPRPAQVVISLSDRPVEFGVISPEATQFFEAYSIQDGACLWEAF